MNRRKAIALTPDEQHAFLDEGRTIVLASLDRHGYPDPVAMWYALEPGNVVVMTTFAKSQKALNLRRDPRCTLMLESGTTYDTLKGVVIRGRAEIDGEVEHVLDVLERVHARYQMPGHGPELRAALHGQASKRCLVRIRPERISSWDHSKLAGAY